MGSKLELRPPIVITSGVLSYVDVFELWEETDAAVGGYITKSYGVDEREGNENVTVYELPNGALNSMGLSNPGVKRKDGSRNKSALDELRNARLTKPLIVSVMGFTPQEYGEVVDILEEEVGENIAAYEGNGSCKNIVPGEKRSVGESIGDSPEVVGASVMNMRRYTDKPIIFKISPKCDVKKIARAAEAAGADYIGCANTMPGLVLRKGKPVLAGGSGGISGPAVKSINLNVVRDVREVIEPETGIVAYGGIETVEDIRDYREAGAEIFGLGTVFKYKDTHEAVEKTKRLAHQLALGTISLKKGAARVKKPIKEFRVEEVIKENHSVKTFIFNDYFEDVVPGQFVMVGLEDGGEKPFSLSRENAITVRKMPRTKPDVPTFTERMFRLKEEDSVYLRGPLGNGFNLGHGEFVLVGGGIGLAPLRFVAQKPRDYFDLDEGVNMMVRTFAGGKNKEDVLFVDEFRGYSDLGFHTATEDGSEGYYGTVVDMIKSMPMDVWKGDEYLICGPEAMEVAAADLLVGMGVEPDKIQISIERYMKCGMGLCGSCSCGGYRTCVDGPVFTYDVLKRNKHFGKLKREKSGRLVDI